MAKSIARILLALGGATAVVWVIAVFPVFRSEKTINDVFQAVIAGEAFSPDVLAALEPLLATDSSLMTRSSMLTKAAVIRLRQAEDAFHSGDTEHADQKYKAVGQIVHDALRNAPSDSFLWLVLFVLESNRDGVRPENLRFLRMSYELGPNEGWIAVKRNGVAMGHFAALPNDLAETAISEFVTLVRWGLVNQAAEIANGPARALRSILFPRLEGINAERRRAFADVIYRDERDDVPVPGFAPPSPKIPMPSLPPDF